MNPVNEKESQSQLPWCWGKNPKMDASASPRRRMLKIKRRILRNLSHRIKREECLLGEAL